MASSAARKIYLGNVAIGGGAPVSVQSMANTDTRDAEASLAQIARLKAKGCEICRLAAPDMAAVKALRKIADQAGMPIVADVHFDASLAIAAIEAGCAGARINPGNIGGEKRVLDVADAAKANGAVIRVGVNSGSLPKGALARHGGSLPEAMAQTALEYCRMIEKRGFHNIKLSLKSSSVIDTVAACRRARELCDYPQHIGVTEAGTAMRGAIKSAVGLGILLHEGIGETMRVSLTASPLEEVDAAYEILRALGLRSRGPEIVSCPTCGRTEIDLIGLAEAVEKTLEGSRASIKVAVMGCPVNGPGEARDADIGIAGGKGKGVIFRKGKIVGSAKGQAALLESFTRELRSLLDETEKNGTDNEIF